MTQQSRSNHRSAAVLQGFLFTLFQQKWTRFTMYAFYALRVALGAAEGGVSRGAPLSRIFNNALLHLTSKSPFT